MPGAAPARPTAGPAAIAATAVIVTKAEAVAGHAGVRVQVNLIRNPFRCKTAIYQIMACMMEWLKIRLSGYRLKLKPGTMTVQTDCQMRRTPAATGCPGRLSLGWAVMPLAAVYAKKNNRRKPLFLATGKISPIPFYWLPETLSTPPPPPAPRSINKTGCQFYRFPPGRSAGSAQ